MKIVINRCYGGFGLSQQAELLLADLKAADMDGIKPFYLEDNRNDPNLVAVVEELGEAANGDSAHLKVVEIPDGVEYTIEEYDGIERIVEVHRTWW